MATLRTLRGHRTWDISSNEQKNFVQRLKRLKEEYGSLQKLAESIKEEYSSTCRIFKGERNPSQRFTQKIADLLKTTPERLFKGNSPEKDSPEKDSARKNRSPNITTTQFRILDFLRKNRNQTAGQISHFLGYTNSGGVYSPLQSLVEYGILSKTLASDGRTYLYDIVEETSVEEDQPTVDEHPPRNYPQHEEVDMLMNDKEFLSLIKEALASAIPTIKKFSKSYNSAEEVPAVIQKEIIRNFLATGRKVYG